MLYNFDRLIDKYSGDFTLVSETEGNYIGGKYISGETTEITLRGAIVPIADNKVYQSGGTYTTKDRELYMRTPIDKPLETVKVRYKNNEYKIEQVKDFSDYANAYIYLLKWVSGFD